MRSFYAHIPQKVKKTVKSSVFFANLGSVRVKAARKMLVKSTPDLYHRRLRGQLSPEHDRSFGHGPRHRDAVARVGRPPHDPTVVF